MIEISGFTIIKEIGQGAMAKVFLAKQHDPERLVVVKLLVKPDNLFRELFVQEKSALGKLVHPNIVTVLLAQSQGDNIYIAMPYYSEGDLKSKLGKPLDLKRVFNIAKGIASGLDFAHQQGMVHRDLKPANILFHENGEPVIADFGLVKSGLDGKSILTAFNVKAAGTPEYISPEQWANPGKIDARSDLFSLGLIIYEMLTGMKAQSSEAVYAGRFSSAPELSGDLSAWNKIVQRLTAIDPEKRYSSSKELLGDLHANERALMERFFQDDSTIVRVNNKGTEEGKKPDEEVKKPVGVVPILIAAVAILVLAYFGLRTQFFDKKQHVDSSPSEVKETSPENVDLTVEILTPPTFSDCQNSNPFSSGVKAAESPAYLRSGDCFALSFSSNKHSDVFLLVEDKNGIIKRLLPSSCAASELGVIDTGISSGQKIHLPLDKGVPWVFMLDQNVGVETFFVLAVDHLAKNTALPVILGVAEACSDADINSVTTKSSLISQLDAVGVHAKSKQISIVHQ